MQPLPHRRLAPTKGRYCREPIQRCHVEKATSTSESQGSSSPCGPSTQTARALHENARAGPGDIGPPRPGGDVVFSSCCTTRCPLRRNTFLPHSRWYASAREHRVTDALRASARTLNPILCLKVLHHSRVCPGKCCPDYANRPNYNNKPNIAIKTLRLTVLFEATI